MMSESTRGTIDRFNEAFNSHDADALARVLTDDTVFEDTSPPPDGRRIEGKAAVVDYWRARVARNQGAVFVAEDVIVGADRAGVPLVYLQVRNGQPRHPPGVDRVTVLVSPLAAS